MNVEQQFVDLIKEGKVADAMQLIKKSLTEMAGSNIVESKFKIAEAYGMKKKEEVKEMDDEEEMEDDDKEEMDDEGDKEDKEKEEKE